MNVEHAIRIVAFDVRPRRIGHSAFESPARLLDFGVMRFGSLKWADGRVVALFRALRPTVLVLQKIPRRSQRDRSRTMTLVNMIIRIARRSWIEVVWVGERELKEYFRQYGKSTKYTRAVFLASAFPELTPRLPSERKTWETENRRMPIFDSVALGIVHIASSADGQGMQDLIHETWAESFRRPLGGVAK